MTTPTETQNPTPQTESEESSGRSVTRIVKLAAGAIIGVIVGLFVLALIISLTASETWAPVVQIIRDTVTIVLMVQGILIVGAMAILVLQIARFVNLLQTEIKPILDNARETTKATKATAEFVGKNAVEPIVQFKAFFAGLTAFIRELLKIRNIVRPNKSSKENKDGAK